MCLDVALGGCFVGSSLLLIGSVTCLGRLYSGCFWVWFVWIGWVGG